MSGARSAQEVQDQFAEAAIRFMNERSTIIETTLFDLPSKVVLGNYCGADVIPSLVREMRERAAPEELGRRRRTLGVPLALDVSGLLWIYLFGRTQRYLDAGWPEREVDLEDSEDAALVIQYWDAMTRTYRGDGSIVPGTTPAEAVIRCLDEADVSRLVDSAHSRGAPEETVRLRRALAQIEVYLFLTHGEQRDGIYSHGPYPCGDGTQLVVKELTDLQNRFMPWMTEDRRLPASRVVIPTILRDVDCQFDLFGTLYTEPEDYFDRIVGFDILAGEELSSISEVEFEAIGAAAQRVQPDVFREMARWDEEFKLGHAGSQYGNVLTPYLELVDCTDEEIDRLLMQPFVEAGRRNHALVAPHAGKIWERLMSGEQPLFPEVRA